MPVSTKKVVVPRVRDSAWLLYKPSVGAEREDWPCESPGSSLCEVAATMPEHRQTGQGGPQEAESGMLGHLGANVIHADDVASPGS